jgi:hypothetical protein
MSVPIVRPRTNIERLMMLMPWSTSNIRIRHCQHTVQVPVPVILSAAATRFNCSTELPGNTGLLKQSGFNTRLGSSERDFFLLSGSTTDSYDSDSKHSRADPETCQGHRSPRCGGLTLQTVTLCRQALRHVLQWTILTLKDFVPGSWQCQYHSQVHSACRGALNVVKKARCWEGVRRVSYSLDI